MQKTNLGAFAAAAALAFCAAAVAQQGGALGEALQSRLAAVKENAAANKAALRQYAWTETVQFSMNGEVRSTKQMSCRYGPDGSVAKTPIGPPPEEPKAGPLKRRIMEEKKEDVTAYMEKVHAVMGLYVPPDGQKMEQAYKAGNLSLGRPAAGEAGLDFKNYAKPGDTMNLDFSMAAKKLASLNVNSYVDDPSQPVSLVVRFATLPDGTSYPSSVNLNAPAKSIQVTIANSNYQKVAGP